MAKPEPESDFEEILNLDDATEPALILMLSLITSQSVSLRRWGPLLHPFHFLTSYCEQEKVNNKYL